MKRSSNINLDIVFDDTPSPEGPRFVECEIAGKSVHVGTWIKRPDDLWALRIVVTGIVPPEERAGERELAPRKGN